MAINGDADEFDPSTILNQGVIAHIAPTRGRRRAAAEKTLLITGLARSGTSMLAALLQAAGVWLGDHVYQPINEDAEITQMLRARDFTRLDALIGRQNAKAPVWGFKMPDLHQFLQHDEMVRFRNPHLMVIFRDPVAVAARNMLSEQVDGTQAIIEATSAMHALTQFVRASHLPFLFLSYEKALVFPRVFIDNVLDFCGIVLDEAKRAELLEHVQPNRSQYVLTANRTFEGHLEGVLERQAVRLGTPCRRADAGAAGPDDRRQACRDFPRRRLPRRPAGGQSRQRQPRFLSRSRTISP